MPDIGQKKYKLCGKKGMKRLIIEDSDGIKEKIQHYFNDNEESKFIHTLHDILLVCREGR